MSYPMTLKFLMQVNIIINLKMGKENLKSYKDGLIITSGHCRSEIYNRLFVVLGRLAKTIYCLMKSIVQTLTTLPLLRKGSGFF